MKQEVLFLIAAITATGSPLVAANAVPVATPAASAPVLNPDVPAPHWKRIPPTPAQLAEGSPLSVCLKFANIIGKDDATHKPMEEAWPIVSPGIKKIYQTHLNPQGLAFLPFYKSIKGCDLTKPVKFRSFVNDGDTVILELEFREKNGKPYAETINLQKKSGKWIICQWDEQPKKYQDYR